MGGLKSNLLMIGAAILVLVALLFAKRELNRALAGQDGGESPAAIGSE